MRPDTERWLQIKGEPLQDARQPPTADSCRVKGAAFRTKGQDSWSRPRNPVQMYCGLRAICDEKNKNEKMVGVSCIMLHHQSLNIVGFLLFYQENTNTHSCSSFISVQQLWGPRPTFQGAPGPLQSILCVGRALLLPQRAGGVLPLQQHRQRKDGVLKRSRALCQGEKITFPPTAIFFSTSTLLYIYLSIYISPSLLKRKRNTKLKL